MGGGELPVASCGGKPALQLEPPSSEQALALLLLIWRAPPDLPYWQPGGFPKAFGRQQQHLSKMARTKHSKALKRASMNTTGQQDLVTCFETEVISVAPEQESLKVQLWRCTQLESPTMEMYRIKKSNYGDGLCSIPRKASSNRSAVGTRWTVGRPQPTQTEGNPQIFKSQMLPSVMKSHQTQKQSLLLSGPCRRNTSIYGSSRAGQYAAQ